MTKIISGFLGLLMVAAVVGGTAYALFSSQATVNGININAGNASLLVSGSGTPTSNNFNTGLNIQNVFPGFQDDATFVLRNASTSNIALTVVGQLTAAGNWDQLADAVEVAVYTSDDSAGTGWYSLRQWNAGTVAFPGPAIAQNSNVTYKVYVRVPLTYNSGALTGNPVGNEISGQSLTNVTFTLTGTQVAP